MIRSMPPAIMVRCNLNIGDNSTTKKSSLGLSKIGILKFHGGDKNHGKTDKVYLRYWRGTLGGR